MFISYFIFYNPRVSQVAMIICGMHDLHVLETSIQLKEKLVCEWSIVGWVHIRKVKDIIILYTFEMRIHWIWVSVWLGLK